MEKNVTIIGAGLCGSLLAGYLGSKGFGVDIYDKRPDPRMAEEVGGRSINLALSDRGLNALALVDCDKKALELSIPMHARYIHFLDGASRVSPYSGRENEHINSIGREGLNELLIETADQYEGVNFHFDQGCIDVDFDQKQCTIRSKSGDQKRPYEILFGTDGAGSIIRRSIFETGTKHLFNFSQDFLRHGYKELHIYPDSNGNHILDKNALHIWPRGSLMVIALPNLDGSFTVTCFFPFKGENGFDAMQDKTRLAAFFNTYFPDVWELIPDLSAQFDTNPTGILGTIKCFPWSINDNVMLLGDAAHAVVPFYGQGMNCSFEDVLVLDEFMEKYNSWEDIFDAYQNHRKVDADAIADLAIDNFYEMRDHVAKQDFIEKRDMEMKLEKSHPDYYSKYSMVTFKPEMRYSEAMNKGRAQDDFLLKLCREEDLYTTDMNDVYKRVQKEIWEEK